MTRTERIRLRAEALLIYQGAEIEVKREHLHALIEDSVITGPDSITPAEQDAEIQRVLSEHAELSHLWATDRGSFNE